MDGLGAASLGDGDDLVYVQVSFFSGPPIQGPRFIGHQHVRRRCVGVRINGGRGYAHGFQRLLNPDGDLTPVGYQYLREHHIRNTPVRLSGNGALSDAAMPTPTTVRVFFWLRFLIKEKVGG